MLIKVNINPIKYGDLTFQGHPRSKVMRGNECLYMTSYLLSIVTMRLVSTVLKIQLFENIRPWYNLSRSLSVKNCEEKWKFTYDFLSVVKSNYETRIHRFEDAALWKYFDLDLIFWGKPRSKVLGEMKVHIWLPICCQW